MSAPSESSAPNPLRSVAWVCALLLCLALGALVYLSVDRRYLAAAAKTAKRERDQLLATQQLAGGDRSADDAKLRRLQASLTRLRNQLQTQRTLAARKQESLRLLWSKGTRLAAFTRAGAIGGQASLLIDGGLRHGVVQITGLRLPSGQLPSLWLKRGADYTLVSRLISNGFSAGAPDFGCLWCYSRQTHWC